MRRPLASLGMMLSAQSVGITLECTTIECIKEVCELFGTGI